MKFWRKLSAMIAVMLVMTVLVAGCGNNAFRQSGKVEDGQLTIQVIDVGQGDAILIRGSGQTVLVDTGDVPAREKLVTYLKSQGVSVIDKVIITHPHADHLGGMAVVLEHFTVKQVYDSGQTTTTALYRNYLTAVQKKNIPFAVVQSGMQIDIGKGAVLRILAPEKPFIANSELNNNSVVVKLVFKNFAMLLTGDAEHESEERMLNHYGSELKSTILKSGHHGSHTSSSLPFMKAVAPQAVVISVGAGNDYHHPHPSTIKRYKELRIPIYRTDTDGTITVRSDGDSYNIYKEK